ncbi:MAG: hypothetical protein QME68_06245, partial [Elusimicrobiota bacterium]|nr:hypothetical protein [Elusimicrobiota bacterium]
MKKVNSIILTCNFAVATKWVVLTLLQIIIFCCICLFVCIPTLHGFFEEVGISPRAVALGNSFVAVSDDIYAIYYNPAGLKQLDTKNLAFVYVQHFPATGGEEVNDMFFALNLLPKKLGVLAVAWQNRTVTDIVTQDIFYISTARYLKRPKLFLGLSLKILKLEYIYENILQDEYFRIHGTGKSQFAIDLGVIRQLTKKIQLGFCAKNINQPDMGLGATDIIP